VSPRDADLPELDAYDFELPPGLIAQQALPRRDDARLMRLERASGEILAPDEPTRVRDLPALLSPGDLLIVNATRVLAARLRGRKSGTGGAAEALLLGPVEAPEGRRYRALVKISGRLRPGLRLELHGGGHTLEAEIVALLEAGEVLLDFAPGPSPYALGEAPLPPYIRRDTPRPEEREPGQAEPGERSLDLERYQTVFARVPGAVAAPTAGLHLTDELLTRLEAAGIGCAEVVLHVGAGTFRPLRAEDLATGRLHREAYELPEATAVAIEQTRTRGGRVIAVGTTSTRVLETCAREDGGMEPGQGETDLFLRPGARFRVVDGLMTNFHLPRSSLLMLVAAFAGREQVLAAYRSAVERGFRFYSYGDAMLIL